MRRPEDSVLSRSPGPGSGGGTGGFILSVINVLIGLLLLGRPMAAALVVPFIFGLLLLVQSVGLTIWAFRVRT